MASRVNIFWGIPDLDLLGPPLTDSTQLTKTKLCADFPAHTRAHYDVRSQRRFFSSHEKSVSQAVSAHEYEFFRAGASFTKNCQAVLLSTLTHAFRAVPRLQ